MSLLKKIVQLSQEMYDDMMDDPDGEIKDAAGNVVHTYSEDIFYCIPQDLEVTTTTEIKTIDNPTIDGLIPSP